IPASGAGMVRIVLLVLVRSVLGLPIGHLYQGEDDDRDGDGRKEYGVVDTHCVPPFGKIAVATP
ncbi:hypothetical protein, partial [Acidithiobacillus caldus]|uniref:hypothetical protein n=1 Tax=Acidithiobacillus caldus TaxID=33059 RepID=UPI001C06BFF5